MDIEQIQHRLETERGCCLTTETIDLVLEEARKQTVIGFRWDVDYIVREFDDPEEYPDFAGVDTLTAAELRDHMPTHAYYALGHLLGVIWEDVYDAVTDALEARKV